MTIESRDAAVDARLQQAFASLRAEPGHPSEDDWVRFASNEMSSDERLQLADHVVSCAECEPIFRVVSLVGADSRALRDGSHQRPGVTDWRLLAAAAAVVLTIGFSVWWGIRAGVDQSQLRTDGGPAIATPATQAPVPAWASLPAAPEVRLPADLILTMRGTESDRQAFLVAFGKAIAPYRDGRFAEAAAALAPVAERYADVVEIWFYLGTARLYSGAPSGAIEPLRRARASEVVGEDARWLQAVALQHTGQDVAARAELQALCADAGAYRDRACAVAKP